MRPDRALADLFFGAAHYNALIVEPDVNDRAFITSTLALAGLAVARANTFGEAKALLVARPPILLVTEIRLGPYNGLHLALRAKSASPQMMTVLTSRFADPVLQRDADQLGATFVLKPVAAREFLAVVCRATRRQLQPDGTFEPVRPPFERRVGERRRASSDEALRCDRRLSGRRRGLPWEDVAFSAFQ